MLAADGSWELLEHLFPSEPVRAEPPARIGMYDIVGVLGDFERTTSVARFYVAERVGGTPSRQGWEV